MVSSRRVKLEQHHDDDNTVSRDLGETHDHDAESYASTVLPFGQTIDSSPADTTAADDTGRSGEMITNRGHVSNSVQLEQHHSFNASISTSAMKQSAAADAAASNPHQRMKLETHNSTTPLAVLATEYAPNVLLPSSSLPQQEFLDSNVSSHLRAAFAPPVVTKTTRRETFASSTAPSSKTATATTFKQSKQNKKSSGSSSGISLLHPTQNLSSSSSSGDEETSSMMDIFSPPPPSILRTRPRGGGVVHQQMVPPPPPPLNSSSSSSSSVLAEDSTTAVITTSTTFDISVEGNNARLEELMPDHHHYYHHHHHQPRYHHPLESSSSLSSSSRQLHHQHHPPAKYSGNLTSPPTIFTPHASTTTAEGGRMAMSTTQKRLHHGNLVHVPKSREGETAEQLFHNSERDVDVEGTNTISGPRLLVESGRRMLVGSAPAKFHVSDLLA
jgi:hypothetical protein